MKLNIASEEAYLMSSAFAVKRMVAAGKNGIELAHKNFAHG